MGQNSIQFLISLPACSQTRLNEQSIRSVFTLCSLVNHRCKITSLFHTKRFIHSEKNVGREHRLS